jgi:ADP-heptose:LPS heptosyltransferase
MPLRSADPPHALSRILAIRLDNIGDVVMLGPALRALRQAYPAARITLMASPAGSQAAPLLPWVDDVITWRAVWQDIGKDVVVDVEKERELVALLDRRRFDAALIFTSFSQSPYPPAYACYLAAISIRAGQSNEFGGGLLTHWVRPPAGSQYQVERNLHLLREAGIPAADTSLELRVPAEETRRAEEILAGRGIPAGSPYLVLAPGASAAARRYDETRFAQAARFLIDATGLPLVILGSPRETGKFPALQALAAEDTRVVSLFGETTVAEMAGVIQRAALVIANNSSAMHMAAAFRRPAVILFAGTERLEEWAPRLELVRILNRYTTCSPCRAFQCPYQMECLDIPAEEVASTGLELLQVGDGTGAAWRKPLAGPLRR